MAIASAHVRCQAAFESLIEASKIDPTNNGIELEELHELSGKYKLWAGNVGAIHHGKRYEISLDYRLREATLFRDQILQILATLTDKVTSATSLVQGLRTPFEKMQFEIEDDGTSEDSPDETSSGTRDATNDESDESDSPWDISSNSSGASQKPSPKQLVSKSSNLGDPTSTNAVTNVSSMSKLSTYKPGMVLDQEMPQLMKSITLAVTALYRMPIRKAAPFDRLKNKDLLDFSFYQHFDVMYVKDKFPALDVSVATRLGKSITKRRQIIYYRSSHALNLDSSNYQISVPSFTKIATQTPEVLADSELQTIEAPLSITASSKFTLRSKATTFKVGASLLPDIQESAAGIALYPPSEAESRVSAVSSYAGKDLEVDIPSRPKGEDGKELELFECKFITSPTTLTSSKRRVSIWFFCLPTSIDRLCVSINGGYRFLIIQSSYSPNLICPNPLQDLLISLSNMS